METQIKEMLNETVNDVEEEKTNIVCDGDIKNGEWVDLETARKIIHAHIDRLEKLLGVSK